MEPTIVGLELYQRNPVWANPKTTVNMIISAMTAVILEIGVIHLELDHVDKGGLSVDDASNHDG